jgi:hypothetical protein
MGIPLGERTTEWKHFTAIYHIDFKNKCMTFEVIMWFTFNLEKWHSFCWCDIRLIISQGHHILSERKGYLPQLYWLKQAQTQCLTSPGTCHPSTEPRVWTCFHLGRCSVAAKVSCPSVFTPDPLNSSSMTQRYSPHLYANGQRCILITSSFPEQDINI